MKFIFLLLSLYLISVNVSAQDKYFERLFYIDFYSTDTEDSLFRALDSSLLKVAEPLNFFRDNISLTQSEFEQIKKELKTSAKIISDTNTSYRVYFTTSNGFTNFNIFGFSKNYDRFTYVHGPDTSIKIGIKPLFYLKLKDYERLFSKETNLILKQTLINSFKRAFPIYANPQKTIEQIHFVHSPLDSSATELLGGYFNVISKDYLRDHYHLKLLLEPTDSSKILSNEQVESITTITHKEILFDEEYGEIESSYNSPILPSKILFSLNFKEVALKKNSTEDSDYLHIGIEVDHIGFTYVKPSTESTLWQKRNDNFNEADNKILSNVLETYYYHAIWKLISEKTMDISKQISNILKAQ